MQFFKRDGKDNWVDENNVYLGYDMTQDCCEDASWFVSDGVPKNLDAPSSDFDWEGWQFDPSFRAEPDLVDPRYGYGLLDRGGAMTFRIVKGSEQKYLTLYNCHNGYYGHGFTFKIGETVVEVGSL